MNAPLERIARGVWTAYAALWSSPSTVVAGPDGSALVIDPGIAVDELTSLATRIRDRGWRPVAAFATHPHWDHVLWSRELGEVPRWATPEATRVAAARRREITAEAEADAPGHDHHLTGQLTALPEGSDRVPWPGQPAVVVPYRAHCRGSAALVLPEARTMLVGDMLSDTEVPLLDLDAADPLGDHHAALDLLEAVAAQYDVSCVVPGHGTVTTRAGMRRRAAADRAYLDLLWRGGRVDDPRLRDPWVAAEHERQILWARRGGGRG